MLAVFHSQHHLLSSSFTPQHSNISSSTHQSAASPGTSVSLLMYPNNFTALPNTSVSLNESLTYSLFLHHLHIISFPKTWHIIALRSTSVSLLLFYFCLHLSTTSVSFPESYLDFYFLCSEPPAVSSGSELCCCTAISEHPVEFSAAKMQRSRFVLRVFPIPRNAHSLLFSFSNTLCVSYCVG